MTKLITIQSSITVRVTCGLQHQDVTNPDAHVPDRLKVAPEWPKHTILIKQGVGNYPAEIKDWPTVKALESDKVLTIGREFDANELTDEEKKNVGIANDFKTQFGAEEVSHRRRRGQNASLADLAGGNNE